MAVAIGAAIVSKPLWLVCVLGAIAVVGLYGMLAPLLRWWPWSHEDNREEGTAEASADGSLTAWLALRIEELRGLLTRLEEVLDEPQFDPPKAETVQDHFFEIVRDVDRKLHTSAPEWVDYFSQSATRYPVNLRFPYADGYRKQLVPSIQSTIDQIAHIQAQMHLRSPQRGGIRAGQSIHAGGDISTASDIEAGLDIQAGGDIRSGGYPHIPRRR